MGSDHKKIMKDTPLSAQVLSAAKLKFSPFLIKSAVLIFKR